MQPILGDPRPAVTPAPRATIRFVLPHLATLRSDDARWLKQLVHNPADPNDRLLFHAVNLRLLRAEDGGVVIDGGLVDAAATAMASRGYEVEILEGPYYVSRRPTEARAWTRQQEEFVELLETRPRVVAKSRRYVDRERLLECVCQRFPGESISVAVKNRWEAARLALTLRRRVPQTVHTGLQCSCDNRPQLHLMPIGIFAVAPGCTITVTFGTKPAMSRRVQRILYGYEHCCRFAIVDAAYDSLTDRDRVQLEALFGPCLYDGDELPQFQTVNAAILPAGPGPALKPSDAFRRKQRLVWDNAERNRRIAALALQLQRADRACLRSAGLDDLDAVVPDRMDPTKLRVGILVESPVHANELQLLLPNWRVVTEKPQSGPFGVECDGHIVTLPAADAAGLCAEALIYAAGAGDRWFDSLNGFAGFSGGLQLVVDVADDFDDRSRAELGSRVADYRSRGWRVHWQGNDGGVVTRQRIGRQRRAISLVTDGLSE